MNKAVAGLAKICREFALNLELIPALPIDIDQAFDVAQAIGKDEAEIALGASGPPLSEHIDDDRGKRESRPWPWARVSMVLRLVSTLRRIAKERPAVRRSASN